MYIQKRHKAKQEKNKKQRRKLITKKKRTKELCERITRCESPSPRTIMKRTSKKSKQLVIGSVQILKSPPTAFLPNMPHQTQLNSKC